MQKEEARRQYSELLDELELLEREKARQLEAKQKEQNRQIQYVVEIYMSCSINPVYIIFNFIKAELS